jgi:hypothetical protein
MGDFIKKYWFIILPIITGIGALAVKMILIDSRTFDSPEQKVVHEKFIKQSVQPKDQWRKYYRDSADKAHAEWKREQSLKAQLKSDSIRKKHDSLFLDMVQRQTIQIEQIKDKIGR